ncbi:polysaccharide deacetylase family protein [Methanolobus sp. ZRKC3]|uniref:polysaccharide deacetylase family protein n=1 Tax=Methanolobus sp. ZRKC3 TaxID=3125786 RepID=UPI003246071C
MLLKLFVMVGNFVLTIDVENISLYRNRGDEHTQNLMCEVGLPRIINLLAKYDINGTFYFTGMFSEKSPEAVEYVKDHGHEIACHAYDHSVSKAFDLLSYEQQVKELKKAKNTIESCGGKVTSFRAPALRINEHTVKALEKVGFKTDSSVASQRFDGPFSYGMKRKLKWLSAPRKPYMMSYESPMKAGDSNILEIPISAALVPFIGNTMRISPTLIKVVRKYLYLESKMIDKPIVFLFHPGECLDPEQKIIATRRSNNLSEYIFADLIRQRMKIRNMGEKSIVLLEETIKSGMNYGFEFVNMKEYAKNYKEGVGLHEYKVGNLEECK